ncbi:MAG: hypothetical protein ACPL1G_05305 [Thermodesulfovibrionales bacterium]
MHKKVLVFLLCIPWLLIGCLGAGRSLVVEERVKALPFERAWEIALNSAKQMCEQAKKINPYNFPVIVSLGTSKARYIITLRYDYDPEAGSIGKTPPNAGKVLAKQFVPHFGAQYYVHIKLITQDEQATGIKVEVTQMKGVKKEKFDLEAENLKEYYLSFLRKNWNQ